MSARKPSPESGATDVAVDETLGWRSGREAAEHDVSFSTDEQAVIDGTAPMETVAEAAYSPALELATTYYWLVNEVNDTADPSVWPGSIWSFTTAEVIVLDDFESYSNRSPNRPYQTWVDGFGYEADEHFPDGHDGNGSGAGVGHFPAPVMETGIVHGGSGQSLPLYYDNTNSQMDRTLTPAQDWTQFGITTLVIHIYGSAGNAGELYVMIGNTRIPYAGGLMTEAWTAWEIDLAASGASLTSISSLSVGVDGGGADGGLLFIDNV